MEDSQVKCWREVAGGERGSLFRPKVIGIKGYRDNIIPFSELYKVNFSAKLADDILYGE